MLTFTFAGDESGDASFNFVKGASRYFVVTMIASQAPDELRGLLERIRRDSKLSERYEFGYHRLSSEQLRKRVFSALASADFDLIAGAIWRRDTHNDTGAFDAIERKIRKLVEYAG